MPKTNTKVFSASAFKATFLDKIEQMLLEQKATLETELAKFSDKQDDAGGTTSGGTGVFPQYGDDEGENALEVADYEANLTIKDDLERVQRDVKIALGRIKDGTYGICKYCKKPIEEKRLLARPTSSACVACKKAIVQEA